MNRLTDPDLWKRRKRSKWPSFAFVYWVTLAFLLGLVIGMLLIACTSVPTFFD